MTARKINPFQELYVTDSPDPSLFVGLFSDVLVHNASALFVPGNVVVKGTQGSGKSMLLNLLRPEIRLAYFRARQPFPLASVASAPFLGAGINLTRSGALDIGQRPIDSINAEQELQLFPLYFADFVNYFVVRDIARTMSFASMEPDVFGGCVAESRLDRFAVELSRDDCWFGYLNNVDGFAALCAQLDDRIGCYRRFHQFNADLPEAVSRSKTSIGQPIAMTAAIAKHTGAVRPDVEVFVRVDQIERLYRSDALRPDLGCQYRRIINKAIGARDSRVSYKLGTRRYAWEDDLTVFGASDKLENLRDYRVVDLDDLLRRGENTKNWIFPRFAEDAFGRRLARTASDIPSADRSLRHVLGPSPSPEEAAMAYKDSSAERVLRLNDLPNSWGTYLTSLFVANPLDALLAGAWLRQQTRDSAKGTPAVPPAGSVPWRSEVWRKERSRQALLQLTSRAAQRMKWAGADHIIALSGGNISVFISVCHEIWDALLRLEGYRAASDVQLPGPIAIDSDIQSAAIYTASRYWYGKVAEQPKGDDRKRFVMQLGIQFRKWLVNDVAMSYPGWNGFSLETRVLEAYPSLRAFLMDAADYGDLAAVQHTTKERNRTPRIKFYINPILAAHFQIPENHAKEPYYADISDVALWLKEADVHLDGMPTRDLLKPRRRQMGRGYPLFGEEDALDA